MTFSRYKDKYCLSLALDNILTVLGQSLQELSTLLSGINDQHYSHKDGLNGNNGTKDKDHDASPIIDGSIGEHVRHGLDHITALLDVASVIQKNLAEGSENITSCISYDRRQRKTLLETDRGLCLLKIKDLIERINKLSTSELLIKKPIKIEHITDDKGSYSYFASNIEREFMFVFHHLLHHKAVIAIKLRLLDCHQDREFGIAPATLHEINYS